VEDFRDRWRTRWRHQQYFVRAHTLHSHHRRHRLRTHDVCMHARTRACRHSRAY
jgi:hypothetical protein